MKAQLKAIIKSELIKEAMVVGDMPLMLGDGVTTEPVSRYQQWHGNYNVELGDDGRLTGQWPQRRVVDYVGDAGGAGVIASSIAGMLGARSPKAQKLALLGVAASAVPWLGGRAAGLVLPKKFGARRDVTDQLSEYGYENFRNA